MLVGVDWSRTRKVLLKVALAAAGAAAATVSFAAIQLPAEKAGLIELGRQHRTAAELYKAFEAEADGGTRLDPARLPDWTGVYSRQGILFNFDQDQGRNRMPTAKLTPEYEKRLVDRLDAIARGIEFDELSNCAPPGHPRWMTEPFLRDFVITPDITYLINEMVNDIRRIYTDGRDHVPEADRYPLYNGDSIGFWDGERLVIHTNQLRSGQYQRTQPEYSEQVETVEIWEKVDERTLVAHVWVYDPPSLVEPWYAKHTYVRLSDPDKSLRIRYWDCGENQNNEVIQTESGSSQFRDFTFTESDD
ncbi:MAG TPA: hypothetical protein VFB99_07750 [Vicinamibacterales bacterium]|nr:hypothetical protein [Vicinamibacterales bacterium]